MPKSEYLPMAISEGLMDQLEKEGLAEVLLRPAAEEEFGLTFRNTRSNQLVAKVTETKYYRHTQFGYVGIKPQDLED